MSPTVVLIIYCVLILLASLAGGWIPLLIKLTHKRMELAVSFVAGVMLGVGLLHLLPHALIARMESLGHDAGMPNLDVHEMAHELMSPIVLWLLAGFLVMFIIERFFCFHHHDVPTSEPGHQHDHDHDHAHHHHHGPDHVHPPHTHAPTKHHLTWTGAAIGLSIHSLIEGIALAASIEVGRQSIHDGAGSGVVLAGLGTFLVIFLHKPFDSLTIGTLMSMGGRSIALRHLVNFSFSMLVIVGVVLFRLGAVSAEGGGGHMLVSAALAFSAGTFLCIAMSDLLPELQFHQHDRVKLSMALLAGLAIAWLIAVIEGRMEH